MGIGPFKLNIFFSEGPLIVEDAAGGHEPSLRDIIFSYYHLHDMSVQDAERCTQLYMEKWSLE